MMIDEWRQLGFYYDRDDRLDVNQWRFFGSKKGLHNFVSLLDKYTSNPSNDTLSEHDHFGPYSYLKIMTWDKPTITADCIAGTIQDLKILSRRLTKKSEIKARTANSTYPKVAVQWLNQALCFYQSLCLVDSEVLRNRHLRVAANRYVQP